MRRTVGSVTIPCASNAPGRRKRTGTGTSYRMPRRLVVCGTRVSSDRSSSALGAPRTRQGRIFAAKPRSTSQTSPRRAGFTLDSRGDRSLETPSRRPGGDPRPMARNMACSSVGATIEQGLRVSRPQEARRMNQSVVWRHSSSARLYAETGWVLRGRDCPHGQPPAQTRTCSIAASGSSVVLAAAMQDKRVRRSPFYGGSQ